MSDDASGIRVRIMGHDDRAEWLAMRVVLWPDERAQEHADRIAGMLDDHDTWGFIAETADGAVAGFAEVTLRKFANGCETQPVPFLEGIWVRDRFRRQKVGARMIQHIEAFFVGLGYREIGSDALTGQSRVPGGPCRLGFLRDRTSRRIIARTSRSRRAEPSPPVCRPAEEQRYSVQP